MLIDLFWPPITIVSIAGRGSSTMHLVEEGAGAGVGLPAPKGIASKETLERKTESMSVYSVGRTLIETVLHRDNI